MKEQLLAIFLGGIQAVGTQYLVQLLDTLHDHNKEDHKDTIKSLYIGLKKLMKLAQKTKTKFDDSGVQGLLDALTQSAEKYDIVLED